MGNPYGNATGHRRRRAVGAAAKLLAVIALSCSATGCRAPAARSSVESVVTPKPLMVVDNQDALTVVVLEEEHPATGEEASSAKATEPLTAPCLGTRRRRGTTPSVAPMERRREARSQGTSESSAEGADGSNRRTGDEGEKGTGIFSLRGTTNRVELSSGEKNPVPFSTNPPASGPSSSEAEPPGPLELTLAQAIARALENSLELQIELLNPLIEETRVTEALAAFDTTFYVNSALETRQNLLISTSATDAYTGSVTRDEHRHDSFIVAAGLRKPLPTGGVFATQFSAQRYRFNQPGPTVQFVWPGVWTYVQSLAINPSVTTDLTFSVRQPLLRNFGTKVNRAGVEISRIEQKASRYTYQARAATLVAGVSRAYWNLVYQRRLLEVRRRSFEYAQHLYEATKRAVALGVLPGIEAIRTEGAAASREADVILSRAALENGADVLRRLIRKSWADVPDEQPVIPVDEPTADWEPIDAKRAIYTALTHRSDLLAAKERVRANDVRLVVAKNQLLPLLDLTLSYTANGLGGNLASALWSQGHEPLDEVGIFNTSYHDFSATINFELPLGNRQAQSLHTRTRLTKLSHLLQVRKLEDDIVGEVDEAVRNATAYAEQITSTERARELARKRLQAEQAEQEAGTGRILDVLAAEDQLARSEADLLRARLDYRLSLISLAESQGTLVEQFLHGSLTFQ